MPESAKLLYSNLQFQKKIGRGGPQNPSLSGTGLGEGKEKWRGKRLEEGKGREGGPPKQKFTITPLSRREPFGISGTVFHFQMPFLSPSQQCQALEGTESKDSHRWPGLIIFLYIYRQTLI